MDKRSEWGGYDIMTTAVRLNPFFDALVKRYNAQIAEARATISVYLENPVGIGEHPQFIDEINKQLDKWCDAQDKIKIIMEYYNDN